jgi:hypothetical protein
MGYEFLIVNNDWRGRPLINKDGQLSVTPFLKLNAKRKALAKAKFINRCTFLHTWKAYLLRKCIIILDLEQYDRSVDRSKEVAYAGEKLVQKTYPNFRFQHAKPTWTFRGLHLYAPGYIIPRMLRLAGIIKETRRIPFNKFYGGRVDQIINCGKPFPRKLKIKLVNKDTFKAFDFSKAEGLALMSNKTWYKFGMSGRIVKSGLGSKNLLFRHDLPRKYRCDIIADREEFDKLGLDKKLGNMLRHRPSCAPDVVAGKTDLRVGFDQVAYNNIRVSFKNERNNTDYYDHRELDAMSKTGMFDDIEQVEKFFGYPDGDTKKISTKFMLAHHLGKLGIPALFHPEVKTEALTTLWNTQRKLLLKSISGQYRCMVPMHMLHGYEQEVLIQVAPHIEIIKTNVIIDDENKLVGVNWKLVKAIHKDYDGDAVMVYFESDKFKNISTLEEIAMEMHKESKQVNIGRRRAFWKVVENKCSTGGGHNMRMAAMAAGHVSNKSENWFKKFARWARVELETGVNSKKAGESKRRLGWGGICYRWILKKVTATRELEASNAVRGSSIINAINTAKKMKPTQTAGPFENALAHLGSLGLNYRTNRYHFNKMIVSERHKFMFNGKNMNSLDLLRRKTYVTTMNQRIERLMTVASHMFDDVDKGRTWIESQKQRFDELDMLYRWTAIKKELKLSEFHQFMIMLYYKGDKSLLAWLHGKYRETVVKD